MSIVPIATLSSTVLDPVATSVPFQLNSSTFSNQYRVETAPTTAGGFFAVWEVSDGRYIPGSWDRDVTSIYGNFFASDGTALGTEFRVNTDRQYTQERPGLTHLSDGGFLVVYASYADSAGNFPYADIVAQRFDASGAPVGAEYTIQTTPGVASGNPDITKLSNGNLVLIWQEGSSDTLKGKILTPTGGTSGATFTIAAATDTYFIHDYESPQVKPLTGGGFVVTWTEDNGSGKDVFVRQYDVAGTAVTAAQMVNTTTANDQRLPDVIPMQDGGYLVAWGSGGQEPSGYNIYAQRYDASGNAVGGEVRLNTTTTSDETHIEIVELPDGGYAAAWTRGWVGISYTFDIILQRFDVDGAKVGNEIVVNTATASNKLSYMSLLNDGTLLIAWKQDGDIFARTFDVHQVGGAGNDSLTGDSDPELIVGQGGNDTLDGRDGNDTLDGGDGNDILIGAGGADELNGGSGFDMASYADADAHVNLDLRSQGTSGDAAGDTFASIEGVLGSDYDDYVYGDSADNFIFGGRGHDRLRGDGGNDTLEGGAGRDDIRGGSGIDTASFSTAGSGVTANLTTGVGTRGNANGDTYDSIENLLGSDHADLLTGSSGNNLIEGGRGSDSLRGSAGDDTLEGGISGDEVHGGSGIDTASFSTAGSGVTANLTTGVGTRGNANGDIYISIENLLGSDHADLLTGSSGNNLIEGGRGSDSLRGSAGDDTLEGGISGDEVHGGSGIDTASFSTAGSGVTANLTTGVGTRGNANGDIYISIENLLGSDHADLLTGSSGNNLIEGGRGSDSLRGSAGDDTLEGGISGDEVHGGSGIDTASFSTAGSGVTANLTTGVGTRGNATGDTYISIENLLGSDHADLLTGSSGNNLIDGGRGNDTLRGSAGDDLLRGGLGDDILNGGSGADEFRFDTALNASTNVDTIENYSITDDWISLDDSVFGAIGSSLSSSEFHIGSSAQDADDYIIYNQTTGALYYDEDGIGGAAQIQFATLETGLALTASEFEIV
ncbi:hypothetical protein KBY27_18095 [Ruegeria pomeroyi]|uniref:Calcium-binding protein n=1 Tax=Ruegeria pomeroyi TaxID=89184 RepID=A0A9Q3ZPV6_9RHOB|nr:calcium-binding protein [Ruegeria pomeroyi]MCE8539371.1 hypothetical protein [Ruegeria pomeroyi]